QIGAYSISYAGATQDEPVQVDCHSLASSVLGLEVDRHTCTGDNQTYYYTRDDGGLIMSQRSSAGSRYYMTDGLGSVIGMVSPSGTVLDSYAYDPYGG